VVPIDPDHRHVAVMEQLALGGLTRQPTNQGFVVSYERKGRGIPPPEYGGLLGPIVNWFAARRASATAPIVGRGPLIMACQPPEQVPVLATLALEFAVCTRWFCSVPGETWPNRNFMHAATSDGEVDIDARFYTDRTIFEVLEENGGDWHVYHGDVPQLWAFPKLWDIPNRHAKWFNLAEFAGHVATGQLPAYSFLEPDHLPPVGGFGSPSNSQHPGNNKVPNEAYDTYASDSDTDFSRAEVLVARVYEALRSNPEVFRRSILLITYDEHGGFYDHVPPPTDAPSPGDKPGWGARLLGLLLHRKTAAFDFTMLGARVPAIVVSPYVPAGTVDTGVHDHASIPATVRALFAPAAPPLTARDAWAAPFHPLLTLAEPRTDLPDLSAYADLGRRRAAPAPEPEADAGVPEPEAGADASVPEPEAGADAGAPEPEAGAATVPEYLRDFVATADKVRERLIAAGEPEALRPMPEAEPQRAAVITDTFEAAAERHRATAPDA